MDISRPQGQAIDHGPQPEPWGGFIKTYNKRFGFHFFLLVRLLKTFFFIDSGQYILLFFCVLLPFLSFGRMSLSM